MPGSAVATTDMHRLAVVRVTADAVVTDRMRARLLRTRTVYPIPSDVTAYAAKLATRRAIQDHATTRGNELHPVNFPGRAIARNAGQDREVAHYAAELAAAAFPG